MAARWIPNIDSFFDSLVGVIRGARNHLTTNQVDSAEFWRRRLEDYERTVRLLLARVDESRPDQVNFVRDLALLMYTMGNLRETLDARSFSRQFEIEGQATVQNLSAVEHTGRTGRPRHMITDTQIRRLREEGIRRMWHVYWEFLLLLYGGEEQDLKCPLATTLMAFLMTC